MSDRWLSELKEGDPVIVVYGLGGRTERIDKVSRLTPTQIVVGENARYRRSDGGGVGSSSHWHENYLAEATEARIKRVIVANARIYISHMGWSNVPDELVLSIRKQLKDYESTLAAGRAREAREP